MKIPRDVHGDVFKALRVLDDQFARLDDSRTRFSTKLNGEHHATIPKYKPLKTGTLIKGALKPVTGRTFAETSFVNLIE